MLYLDYHDRKMFITHQKIHQKFDFTEKLFYAAVKWQVVPACSLKFKQEKLLERSIVFYSQLFLRLFPFPSVSQQTGWALFPQSTPFQIL